MYLAPDLDAEERDVRDAIAEFNDRLRFQTRAGNRWDGPLRRMTLARNVQGSNSIEGINASVDDVAAIALGEKPTTVDEETERALSGYQLAMTYVLQLAKEQPIEVNATLLRSLHFMTASYDLTAMPGRYRRGPIYVQQEATGDIVHEGADFELVPELVDELARDANATGDRLIDAAMAHLNLVLIHPFKDGNGRMARILQSLVLAGDGEAAPVFVSIEEYLGRHTQAYYDVLAAVGQGTWAPESATPAQVKPWIRFILTAHYNQSTERAARLISTGNAAAAVTELLGGAGIPDRALDAAYDALLGATVTRSRYMASLAGTGEVISAQTATRELAALARAGILEPRGEKRGRAYAAGAPLLRIRQDVGLGKAWRHLDPFAR